MVRLHGSRVEKTSYVRPCRGTQAGLSRRCGLFFKKYLAFSWEIIWPFDIQTFGIWQIFLPLTMYQSHDTYISNADSAYQKGDPAQMVLRVKKQDHYKRCLERVIAVLKKLCPKTWTLITLLVFPDLNILIAVSWYNLIWMIMLTNVDLFIMSLTVDCVSYKSYIATCFWLAFGLNFLRYVPKHKMSAWKE